MVNFKKEHFSKMCELATKMLINNEVVTNNFGQPLNIVELLHTTSIKTLSNIKASLAKAIENLEAKDEWVEIDTSKLDELKWKKELVNLIIGYKRYKLEKIDNERKKMELSEKLAELKESQKTPEDRIKELEAELASVDSTEDF